MKKVVICVLAAAAVLSACSNVTKEKLGLSKKAPDEFMVVPQAPYLCRRNMIILRLPSSRRKLPNRLSRKI